MTTVLLDVDGVVANCGAAMHSLAESLFGRKFPEPSAWSVYNVTDALGLSERETQEFWAHTRDAEWADSIQLYPEADAGVRALCGIADVAFVTSPWKGNRSWCHHRMELLHQHFPDVDVIQTKAKWRVWGDFLVDDLPDNDRLAAAVHRAIAVSAGRFVSVCAFAKIEDALGDG